jgi:hypothetical protein
MVLFDYGFYCIRNENELRNERTDREEERLYLGSGRNFEWGCTSDYEENF